MSIVRSEKIKDTVQQKEAFNRLNVVLILDKDTIAQSNGFSSLLYKLKR